MFNPGSYGVDVVPERDAKRFVCEHHYSGSYPASRIAIGLYRMTAARLRELEGVAVFSIPMQQSVVPRWTGVDASEGAELGRLVLRQDVPFNAETWFLARALRALREAKPAMRSVVSYADPTPRTTADGRSVKPAHWGVIYQASNAVFAGTSRGETMTIAPNGRVLSRRSLSKIRLGEVGAAYAERDLVAAGAPARGFGEDPAAWCERVLSSPKFRRVRSRGNLVYVFPLDRDAREAARRVNPELKPYPKASAV